MWIDFGRVVGRHLQMNAVNRNSYGALMFTSDSLILVAICRHIEGLSACFSLLCDWGFWANCFATKCNRNTRQSRFRRRRILTVCFGSYYPKRSSLTNQHRIT
jgi:hypothetical protein